MAARPELAESYPIHVVCAWIGNSWTVAQEHYLQVTDSHFGRAVAERREEKEAQKAAYHRAEQQGTAEKPKGRQSKNRPGFPSDLLAFAFCASLPATGFEPVTSGLGT